LRPEITPWCWLSETTWQEPQFCEKYLKVTAYAGRNGWIECPWTHSEDDKRSSPNRQLFDQISVLGHMNPVVTLRAQSHLTSNQDELMKKVICSFVSVCFLASPFLPAFPQSARQHEAESMKHNGGTKQNVPHCTVREELVSVALAKP